jgi:hypothetical protein
MKRISFVNMHKPSKLICGTGFIDYMTATKKELFDMFGEPLDTKYIDEYKSSHEWHIEVQHDGETIGAVSIYDYKNLAPDDENEPHDWHLGGRPYTAAMELVDFVTHARDVSKRYEGAMNSVAKS